MLLFFPQHSKSATYSMGMQKTYSLICLAMDEDKIDQTKKAPLKLPFLSWGTKNRQKAASTLCLPSAVAGSSQMKKKLSPFTLFNTESSLYWIFQKYLLMWCLFDQFSLHMYMYKPRQMLVTSFAVHWATCGQKLAETVKLKYLKVRMKSFGRYAITRCRF